MTAIGVRKAGTGLQMGPRGCQRTPCGARTSFSFRLEYSSFLLDE